MVRLLDKNKKIISGLRGIIPSLHTPFLEDNSVDLNSLRKLVDHTVEKGCAGMLVGAVAGETSSLSVYEKQEVMNCQCKRWNGVSSWYSDNRARTNQSE